MNVSAYESVCVRASKCMREGVCEPVHERECM